jgi:hypothetical protein
MTHFSLVGKSKLKLDGLPQGQSASSCVIATNILHFINALAVLSTGSASSLTGTSDDA